MAIGSAINLGLPSLPNNELPPQLYGEVSIIYKALRNGVTELARLTGVDEIDPSEWSSTSPQSTVLTGNATRMYPTASVAIAVGELVNLFDNAGVLSARLADATTAATMAHGIASSAGVPGSKMEIQWLRSFVGSIGGMSLGTLYYLSTTPGAIQNLAPLAVGTIQQPVGVAVAANQLLLDISLLFIQN